MNSERKFALLRIAFGCVWAIDAFFKWQPAFLNGISDMLTSMLSGQPAWVQGWIGLWIHVVSVNPHLFAVLVALIETAIALGLIFGLLTCITLAVSIVFAFLIWSIAEGFGGPYIAGSTDIGCACIYTFVSIALWLGYSWRAYSIDGLLQKKYPHFFLWKDTRHTPVHENKKDGVITILMLGVIILASVLLVEHIPTSAPSQQNMGVGAMAPMGMTVKTYDLQPSDPVPTVDFQVVQDPVAMGGYDIHIITTNFTWTPQNVNRAPVLDQGHAHLYIDGKMYVVYSPYYHINDLTPGQHTIVVALAANDHTIYALNGAYIQKQETVNY